MHLFKGYTNNATWIMISAIQIANDLLTLNLLSKMALFGECYVALDCNRLHSALAANRKPSWPIENSVPAEHISNQLLQSMFCH